MFGSVADRALLAHEHRRAAWPGLHWAPMAAPTRFRYDIATEGKEDDTFGPSKTRVKDEMHDLQDLGLSLLELPADRLTRIAMDETLRQAFDELARIESHGARKRQAQYIGKLLRNVDTAPFEAALLPFRKGQLQASKGFPDLSRWRDRLLAEDGALTEWCARYPTTDTRALRTLIRNARKEESEAAAEAAHTGTAPAKGRHYRALFQQLRATADAAELDAG